MTQKEHFLKLTKFLSIIHHSKGRLRLRIDPKIKNEAVNVDVLKSFSDQIEGIKKFKFNPLIASLTIEYDEDIFPSSFWIALLKNDLNDEFHDKIDKILGSFNDTK